MLRKVPNPNYRQHRSDANRLSPGAIGRLRAIDFLHAQFWRRGAGTTFPLTEWELSAGEQYRGDRSIEARAAFAQDVRGTYLRAANLISRNGPFRMMAGDVVPTVVPGIATLHRMRGAAIMNEPREGPMMRFMGGVPTPIPGAHLRSIGVGAAFLDRVEYEEANLSFGAIGFGQGVAPNTLRGALDPDSGAGGGGEVYMGIATELPYGMLGVRLATGYHDLDGIGGLTARNVVEYNLARPTFILHLRDERATGRSRLITMDGFRQAPSSEDRWNLRMRALGGRGETHLTGVIRKGGDPTLETQTVQVGASGSWGLSAWYSGLDYTWDYRAVTGFAERRLSLHTGRASRGGHAVVARLRHHANDAGGNLLQATGEARMALARGVRLSIEPRLTWSNHQYRDTQVESRVSMPFGLLGARVTGGIAIGSSRDEDYRMELRQVDIALSIVPRARDRGDFEVRRFSDGPTPSYEFGGSYQLETARYESPAGSWFSRSDSGRVIVRVVRSGNRSGVPNVLVTLDDSELRFTDDDGFVVFERVEPGIHVVGIEERSLPEKYEVVHASRSFVTVERGRIPDPLQFEIARPVRRKSF